MRKRTWPNRFYARLLMYATTAMLCPAQTFTSLASFNGQNGSKPLYMSPIQGSDGNYYGTTQFGGSSANCLDGCGTVFSFNSSGTITVVHSFRGGDGARPYSGLIQALNGDLYGTTEAGGANNLGTIFKITPNGHLTVLYAFSGPDGANPSSALVEGTDGYLYGTTSGGGTSTCGSCGTVFRITRAGTFTSLHSFDNTDGNDPIGGVVEGTDGNFYGTTNSGGYSFGTVFKITPGGTLTSLYSFQGNSGEYPYAPLIQALDGLFYGTASGGQFDHGGNVYNITATGTETSLHEFTGGSDGDGPTGPLVQGTDGNFYGTTSLNSRSTNCASFGCGTVFQITPAGTLTTVHSFSGSDGYKPQGGLVQGTDGTFYGATTAGGATADFGTLFSLSMGLTPFVMARPSVGKPGTLVQILGTNLTGATSVTFNGVAGVFKVASPTLIVTKVPAGATTGTLQVVTPTMSLSSNVPFRVLP